MRLVLGAKTQDSQVAVYVPKWFFVLAQRPLGCLVKARRTVIFFG